MSLISSRSGATVVTIINSAVAVDAFPTSFGTAPPSLYIGTGGDITVKLAGDIENSVTFKNLPDAYILTANIYEIVSATASDIVALF